MRFDHRVFYLENPERYARFREEKLSLVPARAEDLRLEIQDPFRLTEAERAALKEKLIRYNAVLYSLPDSLRDREDPEIPMALGRACGMFDLDHNPLADQGVTHLEYREAEPEATYSPADYIPYSRRPLSWHTDGYYNENENQVRAVLLHCVRPAASGGENRILDHEIAYIQLRDENPDYIRALNQPQAMTIPANHDAEGRELRAAVTGPVFRVYPDGGLHMRYSARKKWIEWHPEARAAAERLREILSDENPYALQIRLEAGQGIIMYNIPHNRTAFQDEEGRPGRLIYRARYRGIVG